MRYPYSGFTKDQNGRIIQSAVVSVYLAGSSTAASIYAAETGGTAVNSVTSDSNGQFSFWVDDGNYAVTQKFKISVSKAVSNVASYGSVDIDDVVIFTIGGGGLVYYPDPSVADQTNGALTGSIQSLLTTIGTVNKATIELQCRSAGGSTYIIPQNADWSAYTNVTFKLVPGAVLQIATGTTTTIGGQLSEGQHQMFNCVGSGKAVLSQPANPMWFGAGGLGITDDTIAIAKAFLANPAVHFPEGFFKITDEITSSTIKEVTGVKNRTFVWQSALNKSNFVIGTAIANVEAIKIKDIFLGSKATSAGTATLKLIRVNRSDFDIIAYGGYAHIHMDSCQFNEFRYMTGVNIGTPAEGWPAGWTFSATTYGVYAVDILAGTPSKLNTFIKPVIEAVATGYYQDGGDINIIGGVLEVCTVYAINGQSLNSRSVILGTGFEQNGPAAPWYKDILIHNLGASTPFIIEGSAPSIDVTGTSGAGSSIVAIGSYIPSLVIAATGGDFFNVGSKVAILTDSSGKYRSFLGPMYFSNPDIGHAVTTYFPGDAYGAIKPLHPTQGGLAIYGASDADGQTPLRLGGIFGSTNPTDSVQAIDLIAAKSDGATDLAALGAAETALVLRNLGTTLLKFLGNGQPSLALAGLSAYANNAAAIAGGLVSGDIYRTGGDPDSICIVH